MPSIALPVSLRGQLLNTSFDPSRISAGSTAFLWFDPSDLTTMFQDAAGTTPVTAPAQPVGLVLDKSQGLVLGPELVTNGDFSNGLGGWYTTGTASASVVNGEAQVTNVSNLADRLEQIVVGSASEKTYRISADVRTSSGSARVQVLQNGASFLNLGFVDFSNTTTQRISFIATTTGGVGMLVRVTPRAGSAAQIVYVDNISVRELPGFHATQSTAANRPTYGVVPSRGRVNLLTFSEAFDNAAWVKEGTVSVSGSANVTLPTGSSSTNRLRQSAAVGERNNRTFTHSWRIPPASAWSDPTAVLTIASTFTLGPSITASSVEQVVSFTETYSSMSGPTVTAVIFSNKPVTISGLGGAQIVEGSTASPYQRVGSQFEVTDPVGFPSYPLHYLFFGGDLDPRWLQTSTITPSADKVQVFAGVRKLSDAALGMVVEFSSDSGVNNGSFRFEAPLTTGAASYLFRSRGTLSSDAGVTNAAYAAPITNVITGIGDVSGDLSTLRINGTQAAQNTADQGTSNYLAYPLFIGRRNGTSLAFNGQLFGLIVRFSTANLDASVISQTERWMAYKTGVTL